MYGISRGSPRVWSAGGRAALHADTVDWADMHAGSSVLSDSINDMLTLARSQGLADTNPTLFVTMNSWAASQISAMLLCRLGEEVTEAQQPLARVEKAVEALTRQSCSAGEHAMGPSSDSNQDRTRIGLDKMARDKAGGTARQ